MSIDAKYGTVQIDLGDHTPLADDEPVFILRAQDQFAIVAISQYMVKCSAGGYSPEHLERIRESYDAFIAWEAKNRDLVKIPD